MSYQDDMVDAALDKAEKFKAIANELFDMLFDVLHAKPLTTEQLYKASELLDRVECEVKDK